MFIIASCYNRDVFDFQTGPREGLKYVRCNKFEEPSSCNRIFDLTRVLKTVPATICAVAHIMRYIEDHIRLVKFSSERVVHAACVKIIWLYEYNGTA